MNRISTSANQVGLVDVHQHLLPGWYVARLAEQGMVRIGGRSLAEPDLQWSPERALDHMVRCNIETSILSFTDPGASLGPQDFANRLARECNEYVARLCHDYPAKFGGFAVLPLPDVDASLAELTYAVDTLGLDGVVLLSNYGGKYLGDPLYEPIFAELSRRRLPTFVHPTLPPYALPLPYFPWIMEFVFDTTRAAVNMIYTGTLDRHSNIPIILSHGGGTLPFLSFRIRTGQMIPNLKLDRDVIEYLKDYYYDTTFVAAPWSMASLTKLVDPSHILFGSDFPFGPEWVTHLSVDDLAQTEGLSQHDLATIRRHGALKLFPRLAMQGRVADPLGAGGR